MYWLTGLSGLFLMIAPYIFGYAPNAAALWTSLVSGFVVLVSSIMGAMDTSKSNWEYWVLGLFGVFAIVAPFILGYGSVASAMWTTVIVGAIIAISAASKMWSGGTMSQQV